MNPQVVLVVLLFFALSCDTTEPSLPPTLPYIRTIELAVDDIGITDALLHIQFADSTKSRSFRLVRDTSVICIVNLASTDTIILDEPLDANRIYNYRAYRLGGNIIVDSSQAISVRTLDSSSNAWTAFIDTIGGAGSSFDDVWLFEDATALAVGGVTDVDTSGPYGDAPVGSMFWNGTQWISRRIVADFGTSVINVASVRGVHAFSQNSIWYAVASVAHWDGNHYVGYPLRGTLLNGDETVEKVWGKSEAKLHGVGNDGTVVMFTGTWQKLAGVTNVSLFGIHGSSANEVYSAGENSTDLHSEVLMYDGFAWTTIIRGFYPGTGFDSTELFKTQLFGSIIDVWNPKSGRIYVVGDRVYEHRRGNWCFLQGVQDNDLDYPIFSRGYILDIDGNDVNDFFFVGERATLRHYNGVREQQVGIPFDFSSNLHLQAIAVKGNFAVAVGRVGNKAVAIRLYREG